MFGLIKLAAYAALGYVIYEMYLGLTQEQGFAQGAEAGQTGQQAGGMSGRRAQPGAMTGTGEGTMEHTEESTGMSRRQPVGRGVVPE